MRSGSVCKRAPFASAAALLGLYLFASCEAQPSRLPYIPPTLHNWPQPYRGVAGLRAHLFVTAHLELPEAFLSQGGSWMRRVQVPVQVLAVQHPREGVILIDSGVSERTPREQVWPHPLPLIEAAPVQVALAEPLTEQLKRAGMRPQAVRWIVQTNLRAVRTGYLDAFPEARVVASRAEGDFALRGERPGYATEALRAVRNWHWVDFARAQPLATFPSSEDLFGDGSVWLVEARGVTPGSVAVVVRLPEQPLLWTSDTIPNAFVLRTASQPRGLWNREEWWLRFWRMKRFYDLSEVLCLVPAFDRPLRLHATPSFRAHEIATPQASFSPVPTVPPWKRFLPPPW
jgi:glyoxylase-like metal-dependent hydrolase (beta-lactamase superfamily II)